jgi:hypothetical protein
MASQACDPRGGSEYGRQRRTNFSPLFKHGSTPALDADLHTQQEMQINKTKKQPLSGCF